MKTASSATLAILATGEFYMADLYTFTLVDGTNLYYTTADIDIKLSSTTYVHSGPIFERSKCKWSRGLQVDTLDLQIYPKATDLIEGEAFLPFIVGGGFDGADFTLQRCFMSSWGNTTPGAVLIFTGRVAEIDAGRTMVKMTINSHLELLSQQMPRNLYTPGCSHTLFDNGCTLSKSSFTTSGAVTGTPTATSAQISVVKPDGYYSLGTVTFTSGANNGVSRTIRKHASNIIYPITPFPNVPAPGDTLAVTAGCDKSQATCTGKFSNLTHFRGYPYIPVAETAQ